MLCQFTYKNFKSYRNETIFDMQASPIGEHLDNLLSVDNSNKLFLPVSVIYGPNAGGKSGVLEALAALISKVTNPIQTNRKSHKQPSYIENIECIPFAFDLATQHLPTEFTIYYQHKEIEFKYSLSIKNGVVISESLYKKFLGAKNPAKLFTRDYNGVKLGAGMNKKTINVDVSSDTPYISFLALFYNYEIIKTAIEWFSSCIYINFAKYDIVYIPNDFTEKSIILGMLREIDIPISDISIKNQKNSNSSDVMPEINIIREIDGNIFSLDILQESRGTYKLLGFLSLAITALKEGRLIIADELDSSIHPKLLRFIIKLFKNKAINKNNAQLLYTSHDVTTMKNDLFRRDEIWFAAKDDKGVSDIYSLYDIRDEDGMHVKSTASFDRQYLEGRYGADPYLSEMLSIKWE